MPEHTQAFIAIRNAILDDLDDAERRRLAALLGSMNEPQACLSPPIVRVLGAIAALAPDDRQRLARWCGRYLTRWGQVPVAAGRRAASSGYER